MREILFRGKPIKSGYGWIFGDLYNDRTLDRICITDLDTKGNYIEYPIKPATVGQYTGLKDKYGQKIFEGDIILYGLIPCVVKYDTENARFMLYKNGKYIINGFNADTMKLKEVIGNEHDNPELLDGAKE